MSKHLAPHFPLASLLMLPLIACSGASKSPDENKSSLSTVSIGNVDMDWARMKVQVYKKDVTSPVFDKEVEKVNVGENGVTFEQDMAYGQYRFILSYYQDGTEESLSYESCEDEKDKWHVIDEAKENLKIEICDVSGSLVGQTKDLAEVSLDVRIRENSELPTSESTASAAVSQKLVFSSDLKLDNCSQSDASFSHKAEKWLETLTFTNFTANGSDQAEANCVVIGTFEIPANYKIKSYPSAVIKYDHKVSRQLLISTTEGSGNGVLEMKYKSEKEGVFEGAESFDFDANAGSTTEWADGQAEHQFGDKLLPSDCKKDKRSYKSWMKLNLSVTNGGFSVSPQVYEMRIKEIAIKGIEVEPCQESTEN